MGIKFSMASRDKVRGLTAGSGGTTSAHIMSDEATRKWLQAWKRLMSNLQRLYPSDPSRSVDFGGGVEDAGWGYKGAGSLKRAYAESVASDQERHDMGRGKGKVTVLQDADGRVVIPEKLAVTLKRGEALLANRYGSKNSSSQGEK